MPRVTVVTPSYNQADFLEATIDSVVGQQGVDFDYLVIDGGSTDASAEILRRRSDEIDYWVSEPDRGQADAISKGFARARGDLLCWLNSDDLLLPGALAAVVEFFDTHPECEVVSGGAYCIDTAGRPLKRWFGNYTLGVSASYNRLRFYEQDGVFQQATFWRRSAYEAVGGVDPSLRFAMDRDLFVRLAKRRRFARLPKMLACFRLHDDCKSTSIQHVRREEALELERRYGVDGYSHLARVAMRAGYRGPSLARKAWLGALLATGAVTLREAG